MSHLSRVSSFENFSPSQGGPEAPGRRDRKPSFSPVPGAWEATAIEEQLKTVGAFEVPKSQRILQVGIAVVFCLFAAGIVFGYAAIKPVLIAEQVYRGLCTKEELEKGVRVCYEQEIRLNLMFTVAAVGTNVAALPIGAVLDNFGPRVCGIIGSFLLTIGALLLAFAWDMPIDGYTPGYLFLALGGPFCFISSFQLSNTFPKHSGLILALLTGAFDTSSAVFLVYRLIYQWSNGTFWPKKFFLVYLVVPAFIFIVQLFIMPKESYKTVGELIKDIEGDEDDVADDQLDENTALLRDEMRQHRASVVSEITELLGATSGDKQIAEDERKQEISGVWGVLHGKTVRHQILSPWFILITLFTIIQMTRINFFVATVRPQYEYLLRSHAKAVQVNDYFDFALPLGGILSIPFIGLVLDNTSTAFVLSALVTIATIIGVLGVLPYMWAAYANISIFVLYRPFYYTAISDYAAKVFGFRTFGTVYGLIICLAGLFNFTQSGLDALMHQAFDGNPVPVNLILLGIALTIGLALVTFVGVRAYTMKRDVLVHEAEHAPETLMPGAAGPNGREVDESG